MGSFKYVTGNLITNALNDQYDGIGHGCNCFCVQGAGVAADMVKYFQTNNPKYYPQEGIEHRAYINKLGCIEFNYVIVENGQIILNTNPGSINKGFYVINCYTQYSMGKDGIYVDYDAVSLCMKKINSIFKGRKIGLPQIGAGLAGGDWNSIEKIMQRELTNCDVEIVLYDNSPVQFPAIKSEYF